MQLTIYTSDLVEAVTSQLDSRTSSLIYQPIFPTVLQQFSEGVISKKTANYPVLAVLMVLKKMCLAHGMTFKKIESYNINLDCYVVRCE